MRIRRFILLLALFVLAVPHNVAAQRKTPSFNNNSFRRQQEQLRRQQEQMRRQQEQMRRQQQMRQQQQRIQRERERRRREQIQRDRQRQQKIANQRRIQKSQEVAKRSQNKRLRREQDKRRVRDRINRAREFQKNALALRDKRVRRTEARKASRSKSSRKGKKRASKKTAAEARRKGKAGEDAVRAKYDLGEKGKRFEVNGRIRFPDGVTKTAIHEVKNVKRQGLTKQIKDYIKIADMNDKKLILYLRPGAKISKPLAKAIRRKEIIPKKIPFKDSEE